MDLVLSLIKDGIFLYLKKGVIIFIGDSNLNGEFKSLFFYDVCEEGVFVVYMVKFGWFV